VAQAAGATAVGVTDLPALDAALSAALTAGGVHVVIARVPDRAGEARLLAEVRTAVADRLARSEG